VSSPANDATRGSAPGEPREKTLKIDVVELEKITRAAPKQKSRLKDTGKNAAASTAAKAGKTGDSNHLGKPEQLSGKERGTVYSTDGSCKAGDELAENELSDDEFSEDELTEDELDEDELAEDEDFEHFIEYEEVEYNVDEVPPDTIIDSKFKIISLLGVGSLSVVYLAEHLYLQKSVALKIFKPVETDENARFARIQQEAITLANISHPNIVGVTDLGITGTTPYIVQEFVKGMDLQELLKQEGCFSENRCIRLFSQLCEGIAFLHDCGIVHRDIKPANVIVSRGEDGSESAKLIDLGIAKQDNPGGALHTFTTSGSIFGSPFYMSPEQCQGAKIDKRSDIYSLGCLMYEVLTGAPPFRGATMLLTLEKHIKEPAEPLSNRRKAAPVSHSLEMIVMKCLEKYPDNRFQSSSEVSQALKKLDRGFSHGKTVKVLIAAGLAVCLIPLAWTLFAPQQNVPLKTKNITAPFADKHVAAVLGTLEAASLFDGFTSNKESVTAYEEALTEAERQKAPAHVQLNIAQRLARLYGLDRNRPNGEHKLEGLFVRVKPSITAVELSNKAGSLLKSEPTGSAALIYYYLANNSLEERNYDLALTRYYHALNLAAKAPRELRLVQKINTNLAQLKLETGKIAEGTGLLESTLKEAVQELGQDDPSVIALRDKLIQTYAQQGKAAQVEQHARFVRSFLARHRGPRAIHMLEENIKQLMDAAAQLPPSF